MKDAIINILASVSYEEIEGTSHITILKDGYNKIFRSKGFNIEIVVEQDIIYEYIENEDDGTFKWREL